MCFRPSSVAGSVDNINQGTCLMCGMPVASEPGVQSGECPYCGNPITADNAGPTNLPPTAPQNTRIL